MTERLKQAFEQTAARLSDHDQEHLADALSLIAKEERAAGLLLVALDELKWNLTFGKSQSKLGRLADEALDEYKAGATEPLDLNKL